MARSDQAFNFMNSVKGSRAYWSFQLEVLAVIKQLSCPSFYLTLSRVELLLSIYLKLTNYIYKLHWGKKYKNSSSDY